MPKLREKSIDLVELKPNSKEIAIVLREVQNGNKESLVNILEEYPSLHWAEIFYDKTGDTVLHCASRLGFIDVIDYLLNNFTPKSVECKNKDDKTPLHEGAQFAQYKACQRLIEHGANVNALKRADWTPLMLACTKVNGKRSLKTVQLLVENGALINYENKDGWTALHLISREGDAFIFNVLVKYGLDVRKCTKNGRTALHIAALHGNINIVKLLLNLGINVDINDSCGNTPLHEAVLGRNVDICRLLIENFADIHSRNNSDYSILHLAASEGDLHTIKFILDELKFNVNDANRSGLRALHCAARKCQKAAYNYLVAKGAVNSRDKFGRQPSGYF